MPTALITGASSGIGEEFAYALSRERMSLVLTARRQDRLKAVAERAQALGALETRVIAADLTQRDASQRLFAELAREGVAVDLLVNNAGFGTRGPFNKSNLERELGQIDLNIGALVALTRLFLPGMVERRSGVIINVASTAAFQPIPYMAVYAATKAFVLNFSLALAAELQGTGVHVMALCPGPTFTEFQQVAGSRDVLIPSWAYMSAQEVVAQALKAMRQKRWLYINGRLNCVMAQLTRLAPRRLVAQIVANMYRPRDS